MQSLLNYLENTNMFLLIFQISFLSLITYLVITDDRFLLNRKFIFISIIIIIIIISLYINKMPYLIIKDLFWYSLVINGSFIFHVLILDRIFHWCWKNHYEYSGFIVSRISFTLSVSGSIYLTTKFFGYIWEIRDILFNKISKVRNYYLNNFLHYVILNIVKIFKILAKISSIIDAILINFSIIFVNYSLLILGKNNKNFTKDLILKYLLTFIIFFIISMIIGIPRLYVIWIFQFIWESYKIINYEYEDGKSKEEMRKAKSWIEKSKILIKRYGKKPLISSYYKAKYYELEKIYEKPYHKFFLFDLCKFIRGNKDLESGEYPIKKIYKFYPWKELAIGYIRANDEWLEEENKNFIKSEEESLIEGLMWCRAINHSYELLKEILPDFGIRDEEIDQILMWEQNFIKEHKSEYEEIKEWNMHINYES